LASFVSFVGVIMANNKQRGYEAEQLVVDDYIYRGYQLMEQNRTMRGGEIDIILRDEESDEIVFVEVKLITAMVGDTMGYVTPTKLRHLKKSIQWYVVSHPLLDERSSVRVDVVFVNDNTIVEQYE
jgi:putative endonuclease